MKKSVNLLAISLISIGLTACAGMPEKRAYDHNHSEAWNVAQSGGLHRDIADSVIPKDHADHSAFNTYFATSGFYKSAIGSGLKGFGFDALFVLASPTSQGGRNSLLAWIPTAEAKTAEEAQAMMMASAQKAMTNTLKALDAKLSLQDGRGGIRTKDNAYTPWNYEPFFSDALYATYPILKDEWHCTAEDYISPGCHFIIMIHKPILVPTPDFVNSESEFSWLFSGNDSKNYSQVELPGGFNTYYPGDKVFSLLSENLSENVYFYQAAKKTHFASHAQDSAVNAIPYMLNKGEAKLFITVEK